MNEEFLAPFNQIHDFSVLFAEAIGEDRVQATIENSATLWAGLPYEREQSVLELGPGAGVLALRCALGGMHVTVLEHPAAATLRFLISISEALADSISTSGGTFKIIEVDILEHKELKRSLENQEFDHLIATDVFRPTPEGGDVGITTRTMEKTIDRLQHTKGGLSGAAAFVGIFNREYAERAFRALMQFKRQGTGSIYINHLSSLSPAVGNPLGIELSPFYPPLENLDDIIAEYKLQPKYIGELNVPRHPNRGALLISFDERLMSLNPRNCSTVADVLRERAEWTRENTFDFRRHKIWESALEGRLSDLVEMLSQYVDGMDDIVGEARRRGIENSDRLLHLPSEVIDAILGMFAIGESVERGQVTVSARLTVAAWLMELHDANFVDGEVQVPTEVIGAIQCREWDTSFTDVLRKTLSYTGRNTNTRWKAANLMCYMDTPVDDAFVQVLAEFAFTDSLDGTALLQPRSCAWRDAILQHVLDSLEKGSVPWRCPSDVCGCMFLVENAERVPIQKLEELAQHPNAQVRMFVLLAARKLIRLGNTKFQDLLEIAAKDISSPSVGSWIKNLFRRSNTNQDR